MAQDMIPDAFQEAPLQVLALDEKGSAPQPPCHRARLRERFMSSGADALADVEMLELVLHRAALRRDVRPLAKRLIAQFGDFNHVISAPPARLEQVQGAGEGVVRQMPM